MRNAGSVLLSATMISYSTSLPSCCLIPLMQRATSPLILKLISRKEYNIANALPGETGTCHWSSMALRPHLHKASDLSGAEKELAANSKVFVSHTGARVP